MKSSPPLTTFDGTPWSRKAREAYVAVLYYTDSETAESILEELTNPYDILLTKQMLAWHYMMTQEREKLVEILEEMIDHFKSMGEEDPFVAYAINYQHARYYLSSLEMDQSVIDKEEAKKYVKNMDELIFTIEFENDYVKLLNIGMYWLVKSEFASRVDGDPSKAIEYVEKCIESWRKIPDDGDYYVVGGNIFLGLYHFLAGNFDKAEVSLNIVVDESKVYDNLYQFMVLETLSNLNLIKGDIEKAKEFNEHRLRVARKFGVHFGIYTSLTQKQMLLSQEGKYDEALEACEDSLRSRIEHGDPQAICEGYFGLFNHHYTAYKINNDRADLEKADKVLANLGSMSEKYLDNRTIARHYRHAQALVLKTGNIRKKAQAQTILEELIDLYPGDIGYSLDMLELLFEDAALTGDPETMEQIDTLMVKIREVPLRSNPAAVYSYVSQQTFLAKYSYYIQGDPATALEMLRETLETTNQYNLANVTNEIKKEIDALENDITRWDHLDASVKERIKQSEFDKYIKQALEMMSSQA